MTIEQASAKLAAAREAKQKAEHAMSEAIIEARRVTAPAVRDASISLAQAERDYDAAVVAATPDHPLHGQRVYQIKKTYSRRFLARPDGEVRVEGVVSTYRPGDAKPTWGYVAPGDPVVLPLLKSGKPGKKALIYSAHDWHPVDAPAPDRLQGEDVGV